MNIYVPRDREQTLHRLDRALDGRFDAVLLPQVLLEFYAVVTDARRFERPVGTEDAWNQIRALTPRIPLLDVPPSAFGEMSGLVRKHRALGGDVFDVFLV